MGSSCEGETTVHRGFEAQMIDVHNDSLERNLKEHAADAPKKGYATKVDKRPKLRSDVEASLAEISGTNRGSSSGGVELPCYYINSSKMYYEGQWKSGKPNGYGKAYLEDGSYYQGPMINGQPRGDDAVFVYPDGSYKQGNVESGRMNGHGVFVYKANNHKYVGEWLNDKPHGEGKEYYSDGSIYEGRFVNGVKEDDQAKYTWANGKVYEGPFRGGFMDGYGKLYMKNGKGYYEGEFRRNLKVGSSTPMKTEFGEYDGNFERGEMSGNGVFRWYDKKKYEGEFQRNQLHGAGMITYPNKQVARGQWEYGQNMRVETFEQSRLSRDSD